MVPRLPITLMRVMGATRTYLGFRHRNGKIARGGLAVLPSLGNFLAATLLGDSREPVLWHGGDRACPADRMSRGGGRRLVRYLEERTKQGYTLVTWNGVGFDLDVLAEESGMWKECKQLAVAHVDMMFHVLCKLGIRRLPQRRSQGNGGSKRSPRA